MRGRIVTSVVVFALAACSSEVRKDDAILATEVAQALVDACPVASPGDENARGACAEKLARLTVLRDIMSEPFLWGGQKPGAGYGLADSNTTRFNPLVWRKMYLSLSMFTGERRIERVDGKTVLHLANRFRNELDIGSYPYPFWHSKAKWDSPALGAIAPTTRRSRTRSSFSASRTRHCSRATISLRASRPTRCRLRASQTARSVSGFWTSLARSNQPRTRRCVSRASSRRGLDRPRPVEGSAVRDPSMREPKRRSSCRPVFLSPS
jgi:hypothetical protein